MGKIALRPLAGIITGLFIMIAVLWSTACAPKAAADRYSVRGTVISVEQGKDGRSQVTLLHEAIPEFKNQTGMVVGMEPMAMTFTASEELPTGSLQPQAKIQIVFEVHWNSAERLLLKEFQLLDDDTPLEFKGYSVEMA